MKKREAISKIMKKDLFTLDMLQGTLIDAKSIMEDNHIRHLPVVRDKQLVGILSLTDIHRISFGGDYDLSEDVNTSIFHVLKVEQVMKKNPSTVMAKTTIKEVAEQLAVEEFHALPVVDEKKQLVGIVTTTDLINYLLDQY